MEYDTTSTINTKTPNAANEDLEDKQNTTNLYEYRDLGTETQLGLTSTNGSYSMNLPSISIHQLVKAFASSHY